MAKNIPATLPPGSIGNKPEQMRQQITRHLNKISTQIAQSDRRTAPMDLGHHRITAVADPANATDAVNLRTLKKHIADIVQQPNRRQSSGSSVYCIVMSNNGVAVSGQQSPPYIVQQNRTGVPYQVAVACTGTGTATASLNVKINGTKILASDIVIPPSTTGPYTANNFIAGVPDLTIGALVVPWVDVAGGISLFTIQLEVQP